MLMRGSAYQTSLTRLADQPSLCVAWRRRAFTDPTDGGDKRSRSAYWANSTLDISDFSERFSDISEGSYDFLLIGGTCILKGAWKVESLGDAARRLLGR